MDYYILVFLTIIYWSTLVTRVTPQLNAQSKNPCPEDCKNRNTITTVQPRRDIKYGYFTNLCGKEYFFSSEAKTVTNTTELLERCCELGMWGLSVESYKEQECIIDHMIARRFAGHYLTSGLRENTKVGRKYRWCGTINNTIIVAEKGQWGPSEPNHLYPNEDYVILLLKDTKGLYDWQPENFKFICESYGENTFPAKRNTSGIAYLSLPDITCPNQNCSANVNFTLLDTPDTIVETSSGYIVKGCDTMFYVGKIRVNQSEASDECCKLGMKLVTINTNTKMDCVIKLMRKKIPTLDIGWASAILTSRNFYTLSPKYSWCGEKSIPLPKGSNMWASDEPGGWTWDEACIALDVNVQNRRGIRDDKCYINFFPLCEVPEFVIDELDLDVSDDDVAEKPYKKCSEYECTPMINATISTPVLMSGTSKELCGKPFFFSEISLRPKEASNWCCKLGMTLASVETAEKQNCILDFMKTIPSSQPMLTSGFRMDETDFRNIRWCAGPKNDKDFLITRQQWAQGEPNTTLKERCIGLKNNGTLFGLGINQCNQSARFICEAPCTQQGTIVTEGQFNLCPPPTLPPTTTPPPCITQKLISLDTRCIVQKCTINKTYAVSSPNNSNIPPELGTLIRGSNNTSYFFSNDMMNYVDAEMTCCQLGMQLLELSNPQIFLNALASLFKSNSIGRPVTKVNKTNIVRENSNNTQRPNSSTTNETQELVRPKEFYNCTNLKPNELSQEQLYARNCEITTQNKSNATIENKIHLVNQSTSIREKYGKNESVEIEIKILTRELILKKEQNVSNEASKTVLNATKGTHRNNEQFVNGTDVKQLNGTRVRIENNRTEHSVVNTSAGNVDLKELNGTENDMNVPNTLQLEARYWIGARRGVQSCSKHFWWCSGGDAISTWSQNRKISLDCLTADVRTAKVEFNPELCSNSNFFICQIEQREITTTIPTPVDILNIMAQNFFKINQKTTPKPKKQ